MNRRFKIVLILLTISSSSAFTQATFYPKQPHDLSFEVNSAHYQVLQPKKGEVLSVLGFRDRKPKIVSADLTELFDIIVEFKEEPLFMRQLKGQAAHDGFPFASRFTRLADDLRTIHDGAADALQVSLAQPKIDRQFHKIFFGASLTVPRAMISGIQGLDYVKKIHLNGKVEATLDESVHVIGADSVWADYGAEGDSVVVGIIDTGIDYMHPALGGGFGPGFKVIGGYDAANHDSDPMDDLGHGTHVAGIVAANGDSIKGVAPHAKLMAFKVLDNYGYGTQASVIEGVERAVDPNNDGDFSDKVDIANLSLGGAGTPDDALSTAVDNAVRLGVTVCAAAGNSYTFGSIGSPGAARMAITAGASYKTDVIAYFTSKGPAPLTYAIKPDVVAPGVNIRSTYLHGEYREFSGTSMSSPHVAGTCALLKSLNRNWSPAQLKSAVATTALDLGHEPMVQGAGRIRALNAARIHTLAVPSQLSFGLDNGSQAVWTQRDTIWAYNVDSVSRSFSVTSPTPPSGVTIAFNHDVFSLSAQDSLQIIVTLAVDNSIVPDPVLGSLAYSGVAVISGEKDTLRIPWAFVKSSKVTITSNSFYPSITISNPSYVVGDVNWIDPYHAECLAPAGVYDMMSLFFESIPKLVITEHLAIGPATDISLNGSTLAYSATFRGVDELGNSLASHGKTTNAYTLVFPDSSLFRYAAFFGADSILISACSNRFSVVGGQFYFDKAHDGYAVESDAAHGIQGPVTLTNAPGEFLSVRLRGEFPPGPASAQFIFWQRAVLGDGSFYFGIFDPSLGPVDKGRWNGVLHTMRLKDQVISYTVSLCGQLSAAPYPDYYNIWFYSPPLTIIGDSVGAYFGASPPLNLYRTAFVDTLTFGSDPLYTDVSQFNNLYGRYNILAVPYFYGPLDEIKLSPIVTSTFKLFNEHNDTIRSGALLDIAPMSVAPGRYRLEISNHNYSVRGLQATTTLQTFSDLRLADPDPPRLTSLRLVDSLNKPEGAVVTGDRAYLSFSALDVTMRIEESAGFPITVLQSLADSTRLCYRMHGASAWTPLTIDKVLDDYSSSRPLGTLYRADISSVSVFDSAAVDIMLSLSDHSGNTTEWKLEPAFAVGKYGSSPLAVDNSELRGIVREFELAQNYPNPFNPLTVIGYQLSVPGHVVLKIYDVLGREIASLVDEVKQPGEYKVSWEASGIATGVYYYKLVAGKFSEVKKMVILR